MSDDEAYIERILAQGEWTMHKDPKGRPYYLNKKTKVTKWDLKLEVAQMKKEKKEVGKDTEKMVHRSAIQSTLAKLTSSSSGVPVENQQQKDKVVRSSLANIASPLNTPLMKEQPKDSATVSNFTPSFLKQQTKSPVDMLKGNIIQPSTKVTPLPDKERLFQAALQTNGGDWEEFKDYKGDLFYLNRRTGETTGDLKLFLQIRGVLSEIDETDRDASIMEYNGKGATLSSNAKIVKETEKHQKNVEGLSNAIPMGSFIPSYSSAEKKSDGANQSIILTSEGYKSDINGSIGGEAASSSCESFPCDIIKDWSTVMVRGPDQEAAADRLIHYLSERRQKPSYDRILKERVMAENELKKLKEHTKKLEETNAAQAAEIDELQKSLFYGVGNVSRLYTPLQLDYADVAPLAHYRISDKKHINDSLLDRGYRDDIIDTNPFTAGVIGSSSTKMVINKEFRDMRNAGDRKPINDVPQEVICEKKKGYYHASAVPPWNAAGATSAEGLDVKQRVLAHIDGNIKKTNGPLDFTTADLRAKSMSNSDVVGSYKKQHGCVDVKSPVDHSLVSESRLIASMPKQTALETVDTNDSERIEYLEKVVLKLQCHNRQLKEALEESTTSKHLKANCGVCYITDPWKRLMANSVGKERFIDSLRQNKQQPSHGVNNNNYSSKGITNRPYGEDNLSVQSNAYRYMTIDGRRPDHQNSSHISRAMNDTYSSAAEIWMSSLGSDKSTKYSTHDNPVLNRRNIETIDRSAVNFADDDCSFDYGHERE